MQNLSMRFFFSFYMSLLLSVLMSGWVTFINIGLESNFVGSWVHAFLLAWPAAFVIAFLCSGKVRILAEKTVAGLTKK
ncbi:DUF2798 domain-containing protein [Alteromonas halophila]|uniref:DUF2798 domain-containing protein n=1 Tax=Alteromonas halophila TaxID=516698 RepID=UPI001674F199|nr:DUF2798 domain-containing protein [Alteromonas halophila]